MNYQDCKKMSSAADDFELKQVLKSITNIDNN